MDAGIISRELVRRIATEVGFGGELRNRHAVKLELFAGKIARHVLTEAATAFDSLDVADKLAEIAAEVGRK